MFGHKDELMAKIEQLENKVKILKEALEKYADMENWYFDNCGIKRISFLEDIEDDRIAGRLAREALKRIKE